MWSMHPNRSNIAGFYSSRRRPDCILEPSQSSSPLRYFCTYFDRRYLARGLALYRSLQRHCPDFQLYVLTLDELTHDILSKLGPSSIVCIPLAQLEASDPELLIA